MSQRPLKTTLARMAVILACLLTPAVWWLRQLGPFRPGGTVSMLNYDYFQYTVPSWTYAARVMAHGSIPLWNPYQLCGTPFLAAQQHGALYPAHWVFLVMSVPPALRLVIIVHTMLAMAGAYWCARCFGAARAAALLAGVAYAFSGSVVQLTLAMEPFLVAAAWLPWQLGCTRMLMLSRGRWHWMAVGLGACVALGFLGGHPQYTLMSAYLCGAYALVQLCRLGYRRGGRTATALLGRLALAAAVAVGLSAVQLLPTAELMLRSPRQPGALASGGNYAWALSLKQELRGLLYPGPGALGTARIGYAGTAALLLVAAPLLCRARRGRAVFLWGIGLIAALAALGPATPIYEWYLRLPGAAWFRMAERIHVVTTLCLVLLAALGAESLRRARGAQHAAVMAASGAGLVAVLVFILRRLASEWAPVDEAGLPLLRQHLLWALPVVVLLVACSGRRRRAWRSALTVLIAAATAMELYQATEIRIPFPMTHPDALPIPSAAQFIHGHQGYARTFALNPPPFLEGKTTPQIPVKLGMLAELWLVNDRENLLEQRYADMASALTGAPTLPQWPFQGEMWMPAISDTQLSVLRVLGVRFLVVQRATSVSLPPSIAASTAYADGSSIVYEVPDPVPRAFVATTVEVASDPPHALARVTRTPQFVVGGGAVVETAVADDLRATGSVTITGYTAHAVEMEAELTHRGLVVLHDQYDPFWIATVDHDPVPVLRANYLFRAVPVAAGRHTIRFIYRPTPFYVGAALTVLTLLAVAGAAMRVALQWQRER